MKKPDKSYDVVVIGGGMSGICAALAAAREGAQTALVQDRPVLGGNASSEIRMHICGASFHSERRNARETGILEELLLKNRSINPQHSFSVFDTVLWETVRFQERLDLYLNTTVQQVETRESRIIRVTGYQLTTETYYTFSAPIFVDATGDATVAVLAGADYRSGTEGQDDFGEAFAPKYGSTGTMANSLLFEAVNAGHPVRFVRPEWAYSFTEEDLIGRDHSRPASPDGEVGPGHIWSGYWWVELGGQQDVIADGEEIRDELLKILYGVWDHIKNGGEHGAENYELRWVQFLPGKRESRRVLGDYVLTGDDVYACRVFEDAVAYGGWAMDMHPCEGFYCREEANHNIVPSDVYTIPYRCYYSRNVANLMLAGRNISATHLAFGSTRVMGTCGVGGQAVGTAAAMAVRLGVLPREIGGHIRGLQQRLLWQDCYLPSFLNEDMTDLARMSTVDCSGCKPGNEAQKILSGVARMVGETDNAWESDDLSAPQWIRLHFGRTVRLGEVQIKFDSNLSREIMITLDQDARSRQEKGMPSTLVKSYDVELLRDGQPVHALTVAENTQRFVRHFFGDIPCDAVRVTVHCTYGESTARIFEIRAYESNGRLSIR